MMEDRHERVAGILGGMGPEATVDLLRRIIRNTPACDDRDHVRCLVDNNPKVPSRIKRLLEGGGEDPGPVLADMARRLEAWGADFLVMACNTAHNYYADVRDAVSVPVLNMIELATREAARRAPGGAVGILASPAVRLTGLYEAPCTAMGLTPRYAEAQWEQRLLQVIRDVKAGRMDGPVRTAFAEIVAHVRGRGANVLIIACTELGVIGAHEDIPLVDAADTLARAVVDTAKGRIPLPTA